MALEIAASDIRLLPRLGDEKDIIVNCNQIKRQGYVNSLSDLLKYQQDGRVCRTTRTEY